jgi:hypothetical protein
MQEYQYIDNKGNTQTVRAASPELAMQSAPGISKTSGVRRLPVSPAVVTSDSARKEVEDQKTQLDQNRTDRQRREEERKQQKEQERQQRQEQRDKDREFSLVSGDTQTQTEDQDPLLTDRLNFLQNQAIQIDNQAEQLNDRLQQIRVNAQDPGVNYLLGQVQALYTAKIEAQKQQNEQLMRATEVTTIRTGIARLAQSRAISIMSAEEDAGLSRLNEIEQQRIDAEIKAIQAYQNDEMDIFREQMKIFDNAAEQQRQVAKDMYTAVADSYKRAREEAEETRAAIKFEFDMQEKVADNMANVLINSGQDIGPEELAQVAADYGLDPNTLLAKINEQRIQQNKDLLDIEYKRSQIAKNYDDLSGSGSGANVAGMLTLFENTINSGLEQGQTPAQIIDSVRIMNEEAFNYDYSTADFEALRSYLDTATAVGSEELMQEEQANMTDQERYIAEKVKEAEDEVTFLRERGLDSQEIYASIKNKYPRSVVAKTSVGNTFGNFIEDMTKGVGAFIEDVGNSF